MSRKKYTHKHKNVHEEILFELCHEFGIFKSNTKPDIKQVNKLVQFAYKCWSQTLAKQNYKEDKQLTFYKVRIHSIGTFTPCLFKMIRFFTKYYHSKLKDLPEYIYDNYLNIFNKSTENRKNKLSKTENLINKRFDYNKSKIAKLDTTKLYRVYNSSHFNELCKIIKINYDNTCLVETIITKDRLTIANNLLKLV